MHYKESSLGETVKHWLLWLLHSSLVELVTRPASALSVRHLAIPQVKSSSAWVNLLLKIIFCLSPPVKEQQVRFRALLHAQYMQGQTRQRLCLFYLKAIKIT